MKAVIFDMNGVLINDEPYHKEAWKIFCARHGLSFNEQGFNEYCMGRTNREILRYLFHEELSDEQDRTLREERIGYSKSLLPKILPAPDGLDVFLNGLRKRKFKLAVATSSQRDYADFVLEKYGFRKYFDTVVTAGDVTKSKPDPEIYVTAAERIQTSPSDCLVIEDSMSGIHAAKTAGMKVFGITTSHGPLELAEADQVIASFTDIDIEALEKM